MDKYCPHCGMTKPRDEFYKNASKLDRLSDQCRTCTRTLQRKGYYADLVTSRESAAERARKYRTRRKQRDTNHPVPA